jgi:transposase
MNWTRRRSSRSIGTVKRRGTTVGSWLSAQRGLLAEPARDELADINRLSEAIDELSARIADRVCAVAPTLLALPGCAELTAAKIVSATACVERFRSEAAFARHMGLVPVPHWSGPSQVALKSTRRGNRQLSTATHRIAVVQIRMNCPGRGYFQRRIADGDTRPRALRALKRRLSRVVFQSLRADWELRAQAWPIVGA